MNVASPPASRHGWSQEEWQIRCDLAALYRLCAHHRWTDWIYTHISARVPGPEHHFLLNRYGVMHHEMRASDLVKIDVNGNPVEEPEGWDGRSALVNAAGFVIHSAVHMAREDAHFVIHTHTRDGMAVAAQKHGLLPISQHALKFYGHLAYHDYEGIALDEDERVRLTKDLGSHNAMILRNHGLLVCGPTAGEAYHELYYLERACSAQVAALAGGGELVFPPEEVRRHTAEQFHTPSASSGKEFAWGAALRLIENDKPDYRS
ncbi:class II aldolase/adducin family protein [Siccirubricoccus sp. KC 17139]|uniref:Class II aldolase/adducin family protein n=1 Tax=Siccirubricoccus soli TaxID=2899147 RepID=A0ABT1D7B1_9PROT|nr:class II aldolase/adducin family protein [Siccirubricoccus soli]MCO6417059.1 class II aldolase/adducin family protein [Siccirubricoccus soli]MCP2683194.1 class II aldolase/adducin family protein [Siccirubricoccus soli]